MSGFSPVAQVTPIGPKAGKCPAADTTAFVTACLSANATSSTCQAWQTAEKTSNANCLSCVFTQTTGTGWGPLVCDNNGCKLNVPGCLDLALGQQSQENSTSTGSCGDHLSASYGCQDTACASCTGTDFSTCVNDAVAGAVQELRGRVHQRLVVLVAQRRHRPGERQQLLPGLADRLHRHGVRELHELLLRSVI